MASELSGSNVTIGTLLKNPGSLGWFVGGFQFDKKHQGSQYFSRNFITIGFLGIKINYLII